MQQTETYKLNLIEMSDTFSPDPLNENAQKLEAALDAKFTALDASGADLEERVAALEGHKFVIGHYVGTGEHGTRSFALGFHPQFVLIYGARVGFGMAVRQQPLNDTLVIEEDGFHIYYPESTSPSMNYRNDRYFYLAFL